MQDQECLYHVHKPGQQIEIDTHTCMHDLCTQAPNPAEKGVAPTESSVGWHMGTVMVPAQVAVCMCVSFSLSLSSQGQCSLSHAGRSFIILNNPYEKERIGTD